MAHSDDLALVAACRKRLDDFAPITYATTVDVTGAALTLVGDTLNRHAPVTTEGGLTYCPSDALLAPNSWPCADYRSAIAALHTIATALEVEIPAGDLRTPEEWIADLRLGKVLDPDGWRGIFAPDWTTPISHTEFQHRYASSTVEHKGGGPEGR